MELEMGLEAIPKQSQLCSWTGICIYWGSNWKYDTIQKIWNNILEVLLQNFILSSKT